MKRRQKKKDICPLCGKVEYLTREHIPPKNLFLKPRPKNTITVWTCKQCNASYAPDEEYFRICVCAGAQSGSEAYRLWDEKVENSTFQRSPALKQKLSNDMDMLQQHHKTNAIRLSSGDIVPDELVQNLMAFDLTRINRVVDKIIRCLHFKHFKSVLSPNSKILISHDSLNPLDVEKINMKRMRWVGRACEFIYWFGEEREDGSVEWALLFYLLRHFRITVKPCKPCRYNER